MFMSCRVLRLEMTRCAHTSCIVRRSACQEDDVVLVQKGVEVVGAFPAVVCSQPWDQIGCGLARCAGHCALLVSVGVAFVADVGGVALESIRHVRFVGLRSRRSRMLGAPLEGLGLRISARRPAPRRALVGVAAVLDFSFARSATRAYPLESSSSASMSRGGHCAQSDATSQSCAKLELFMNSAGL